MYYSNKTASLSDIFGTGDLTLNDNYIIADGRKFPVINDVIIMLEPSKWPDMLKKVALSHADREGIPAFARDIQFTFGAEWKKYPDILSEHQREFGLYFDLVDPGSLKDKRVCDLGCGTGRRSFFLQDKCRELVLIDFSESIFVARKNLHKCDNAIFIMADINNLPLRERFADFIFCLGVLHHLPVDALDVTRKLSKYAPDLLVYLYYSLDNRPAYFRVLFSIVTRIRLSVSRIRNSLFRSVFTDFFAIFVYLPLIKIGEIFDLFKLSRFIPVYGVYKGYTLRRIRQDVYDRFFTRIEQRFSRKEIMTLKDTFESVIVSESLPYWHFLCKDDIGKNG